MNHSATEKVIKYMSFDQDKKKLEECVSTGFVGGFFFFFSISIKH